MNLPTKNERRTGKRCYVQHQRTQWASGSGMQAVFLGGARSRRGSGGTGVFLPRGAGNSIESRKQPSRFLNCFRLCLSLDFDWSIGLDSFSGCSG